MHGFQYRVQVWMRACFGHAISKDRVERNHRFLEEALELVQACGCTPSEAHQLVDYVYGRPIGIKEQEVGGVAVTLAALCDAHDIDMDECGEAELRRIWTKVETIRAKQAAKPKHSPLPESPDTVLAGVSWGNLGPIQDGSVLLVRGVESRKELSILSEAIFSAHPNCGGVIGIDHGMEISNLPEEGMNHLGWYRLSGEPVRFDCNGSAAPAYTCSEPGDMSGDYVKAPQ